MKLLGPAGSIRGDTFRIYAIHFVQLGIALLGSVIVARVLGPTSKGIVDLFNLLQSFISEFGMLGFNSGLLFYLANRRRPLEEVHGTGVAFSLGVGSLTAFAGWLALPLLRDLLPGLPDWAILLALFMAPAILYRLIWSNLMTGINRAVDSHRLGLGMAVISSAGIVTLWLLEALNYRSAILLFAGVVLLHASLAFRILLSKGEGLQPSRRLGAESIRYGAVIYIGFLANVLHFKVDQVMLNSLLGTAAVGIYTVGVRWAEMLFLLDNALIASSLFRVSSGDTGDSYRLSQRLFKAQLMLSGASGLALALMAKPLILILYGSEYSGSVLPLVILIPGVVAWSLAKVLSQHIVYKRGKQWITTAIALVGIGMNIWLNLLMIPQMGVAGAALASMISYGTVLLCTLFAFQWLKVQKDEQ